MAVPIKNVYYLLCYAWNRLEARDMVDVSALSGDRLENLFAKVLAEGTSRLISRGLDRGYVSEQQDARSIRGKLLVSESIKRSLLQRGQAACLVDEFSYDVPHNQVLKAGIRAAMQLDGVDSKLLHRLRAHVQMMHTVTDAPLRPGAFRQIQLHKNNARYAFLLNICELLCRNLLPDTKTGQMRFHPFTASDQQMGSLFEAFVRNFLGLEQDHFRIFAPKLKWGAELLDTTPTGWLPEMRTDALLESKEHRIVVEMKSYTTPYSQSHGTKKLISNHLYQLSTYLDHFQSDRPVSGLLLYAAPPTMPDQSYRIRGREIHVRSLLLDQPWPEIHHELLRIVANLHHLQTPSLQSAWP